MRATEVAIRHLVEAHLLTTNTIHQFGQTSLKDGSNSPCPLHVNKTKCWAGRALCGVPTEKVLVGKSENLNPLAKQVNEPAPTVEAGRYFIVIPFFKRKVRPELCVMNTTAVLIWCSGSY